ncbi:MAG: hypothetical protein IJW90_07605 [Clostridia bacterium]|nr:hypothetical protein [Clostridia bacterium]
MKKFRLSLLTAALLLSSLALTSCDDILYTDPEKAISPLSEVADLSYTEDVASYWDDFGIVTALNQYVDTYAISVSGQSLDGNLVFFTGSRENDPSALTPDERHASVALVYHVQKNEIIYAKEYLAHVPEAAALDNTSANTTPRALTDTVVNVSFDTADPQTGELQRVSSLFTVYTSETDRSTGTTTETSVFFDAEGNEIATASGIVTVYDYGKNYFEFDHTLYRLSNDQFSKIADIPAYNQIVPFDYYDGTYFYSIGQNRVNIYNSSMAHIYGWEETNPEKTVYLNILDNGNILVQTTELLPEDAVEYNLLSGKNKYRFSSTLLKPFVDSKQELELDFIVHSVKSRKANPDDLALYQSSVSNIATVTYIHDQRVDMNSLMTVSLTNEATISKSLKIVESHVSVQEITSPGNGYFIVSENGQHHIFDTAGTAIATYNQDLRATHSFLINMTTGTVYNYALEILYQCDANTHIYDVGDTYVLLYRDGKQPSYIFFDGDETVLYTEGTDTGSHTTRLIMRHSFYILRTNAPTAGGVLQTSWSICSIFGETLGHISADGLHLCHESVHGALMQDANGYFYRVGE